MFNWYKKSKLETKVTVFKNSGTIPEEDSEYAKSLLVDVKKLGDLSDIINNYIVKEFVNNGLSRCLQDSTNSKYPVKFELDKDILLDDDNTNKLIILKIYLTQNNISDNLREFSYDTIGYLISLFGVKTDSSSVSYRDDDFTGEHGRHVYIHKSYSLYEISDLIPELIKYYDNYEEEVKTVAQLASEYISVTKNRYRNNVLEIVKK